MTLDYFEAHLTFPDQFLIPILNFQDQEGRSLSFYECEKNVKGDILSKKKFLLHYSKI